MLLTKLEQELHDEIKYSKIGNLFIANTELPYDMQVYVLDFLSTKDLINIISKKGKQLPILSIIKILNNRLGTYNELSTILEFSFTNHLKVYFNKITMTNCYNKLLNNNKLYVVNTCVNNREFLYTLLYLFTNNEYCTNFTQLVNVGFYEDLIIHHIYNTDIDKCKSDNMDFKEILQLLLNLGYEFYDKKINDSYTHITKFKNNHTYFNNYPITIVAKYGNVNAFELLLKYHNDELHKNINYTIDHHNCILYNILKLCCNNFQNNLLANNFIDIVNLIIKYNNHFIPSINILNNLSLLMAHNILEFNRLEILNELLINGLNVNIRVSSIQDIVNDELTNMISAGHIYDNKQLIHGAVSDNRYYMTQLLLEHNVNINSNCNIYIDNIPIENFTPLHIAVHYNYVSIIKLILNHNYNNRTHKLNVNAQDDQGKSPIFYTKCNNILRLLINYGADMNVVDNYGNKMIDYI